MLHEYTCRLLHPVTMQDFPLPAELGARWEHTSNACEAGEQERFQFPGFSPGLSLPILTQMR